MSKESAKSTGSGTRRAHRAASAPTGLQARKPKDDARTLN